MINIKAIDFEKWGGLDNFLIQSANGYNSRASLLKSVVPWLAKANNMTKNAVANLPFDIVKSDGTVVDTSTDWKNVVGFMDNPKRTMSLLAGALCGGSGYLLPFRTTSRIIELRYVAPQTITPWIDSDGLKWFDRSTAQGKYERLQPNELFYFWLPDSDVEIGPPVTSPMSTALMAAELLASMSGTMKIYGDRGFVPAYIGQVKGMPSKDEKEKAENYLTRFLRGAYASVVKLINAESLELQRVGAGMEELKGAYSEIQQQAIEDVGTAFGIPAALFMSDKAFASEVAPLVRQWYETSEFISIYHTIEEGFNSQILNSLDLRLQYKPESLDVFQEDENARASSVNTYVDAISKDPQIAKFVMSFMGVDLDEEQEHEFDEIIIGKDEAKEEVTEASQPDGTDMESEAELVQEPLSPDEVKDLALWYDRARSWYKKGKGGAADWENKHLREEIAAPIRLKLAGAQSDLDIVKAFEIGKAEKPVVVNNAAAIKGLAEQLERAIEVSTQPKEMAQTIIIDTQGNAIKANGDSAEQILQAIKMMRY